MRALLFETRTGNPVIDLERTAWDWDTGILAEDKATVVVPAYTPRSRAMDLRGLLTPFKHSLALIDESVDGARVVRAAGPITQRVPQDDADGRPGFKVTARGLEVLLRRRFIRLHPGWPLIDGDGLPTGLYDQTFENAAYGTIIKHLVQESEKFPGGDLPIIYEADRVGVHERTQYAALDGKPVLEAMDQIADLADGVEYDFRPVIDDTDHITYQLVTGTDADMVIVGQDAQVWNIGGASPDVRGWEPADRTGDVATDAFFTGGKDDDRVLVARASDPALIDDGWPRLEIWDSSHSSVSTQATLQGWADGALRGLDTSWPFEVRAERALTLRHGDLVTIHADGHWDLQDGTYQRRVLSINQKSSSPDWVGVQLI